MRNRHLYILTGALCLIGIGIFLYKFLLLELPLRPAEKVSNWEIEVKVTFVARDVPVKLSLYVPQNEQHFAILGQSFLSEGYGLTTAEDGDNRLAIFTTRSASGEQTIYYRFGLYRTRLTSSPDGSDEPVPIMPTLSEPHMAAARGLVRDLQAKSADDESLARLVLKALSATPPTDEVRMLLGSSTSNKRRVAVAAQMLAIAGIPARVVNGVRLTDVNRQAPISSWLEAYIDNNWRAFPSRPGRKETNNFPWWRGIDPLVTVDGARTLRTEVTVSATTVSALRNAVAVDGTRDVSLLGYSLFTLPLDTQQVYKIILTVPLGVFFLTVLRNVIGLRTFGTFMPVLIGIAFRETHVFWGVVLFSLVVSIGLIARLYLETLRLLVVPRLASVLIIVVLTMAGISVLSNQLGIQRGLSVALFPMVILTMTVERMSIIWDERGPAEMVKLGVGSLIVAIIAYFIMFNSYVEHICFVFPELLLIVLACSMLLGRYSGYRLFDLPRFRVLSGGHDR